jgi:hypothetical protein
MDPFPPDLVLFEMTLSAPIGGINNRVISMQNKNLLTYQMTMQP